MLNETKHGQKGMFEELYENRPRLEQFMRAMTALSGNNFEAFAEKFDFSNFKTRCDVAGIAKRARFAIYSKSWVQRNLYRPVGACTFLSCPWHPEIAEVS
jgi:hypothetical protein